MLWSNSFYCSNDISSTISPQTVKNENLLNWFRKTKNISIRIYKYKKIYHENGKRQRNRLTRNFLFVKTFNSSFRKFAHKVSRDTGNRKQDQHITWGRHRHNNVADTSKSICCLFDVDRRANFKSSPSTWCRLIGMDCKSYVQFC